MNIGNNIRRYRLQQGMTQQDVASICGLTKGMISKIESGKVTPALATLTKIANAIGVDIIALMAEKKQRTAAFTAMPEEEAFVETDLGYRMCGLARKYFGKQLQPVLIVAQKDRVQRHLVSHDDEEFIYVLSGTMVFQADGRLYTLNTGDSLYFDGTREHGIYEIIEDTTYLDIFMGQQHEARATSGVNRAPALLNLERLQREKPAHRKKEGKINDQ